jgi:hypothetical protein
MAENVQVVMSMLQIIVATKELSNCNKNVHANDTVLQNDMAPRACSNYCLKSTKYQNLRTVRVFQYNCT